MSENLTTSQAPVAESVAAPDLIGSRVQQLGRTSVMERFAVDVAELEVPHTEVPSMATQSPTEYYTGQPGHGQYDHDSTRDL